MQRLQRLEKLRHELRTFLNHIIGYSEILQTDAREYGKATYIDSLENISTKANKVRRLINFFLSSETDYIDVATSEDIKKAFLVPLIQIMSDTRRLIVQFKREDPSFIHDAEQILSVTNQMLQLVEEEIIDIQLEELYKSTDRENHSLPTATSHRTEATESEGMSKFKNSNFEQEFDEEKAKNPGSILLVDDSSTSRILIGHHLKTLGHSIIEAKSGEHGLKLLEATKPDLIILDVLMSDMTGYHILRELKKNEHTKSIPVIMLSAVQNFESIAQCIKMGAEDYLPKDYEPSILKARIDASLEKTLLQKERDKFTQALLESQTTLAKELNEAAQYITGQLPQPLKGSVESSLYFLPSAQLGGDFLNHFWLDDTHLCIFLLDASGHGIRSTLQAISISNLINSRGLSGTDYFDPKSVLEGLNSHFQIQYDDPSFFTLWYGVYNKVSRELRYSCAGSPPGILLRKNGDKSPRVIRLGSKDIIIGALENTAYADCSRNIAAGDRLFLFSDGAYEVTRNNGKMIGMEEFIELITLTPGIVEKDIQQIITQLEALSGDEHFEDDISLLELYFK